MSTLSPEELHKISTLLNHISLVGLKLGFEPPEVERYEQKNVLTLPKNVGTYDMLKDFDERGGTKDQLLQALHDSQQSTLANRVSRGIFTQVQSNSTPEEVMSGKTAQTSARPSEGELTEETLYNIGRAIPTEQDMENLAVALEVDKAALNRYKATNYRGASVTAAGTCNMLFDWQQRVEPTKQKPELWDTLTKAGLVTIRDKFLSDK